MLSFRFMKEESEGDFPFIFFRILLSSEMIYVTFLNHSVILYFGT